MKRLGVFLVILVLLHVVSSSHWISGWVEDALDGEGADGKDVVLWNPSVGMSDNLTDVVGATGNSGVSGVYMMDCELLGAGCSVNDILSLKVFGEEYISWVVNLTVTGAGYDVPDNLSLNSPPSSYLIYPGDSSVVPGDVSFNCSFFDYDDNIDRVSLWSNWSGSWVEEGNVTSGFGDGYVIFNESIVQGNYKWNCFVEDDLEIGKFNSSNNSFFVDTTPPVILGISSVTDVCGFGSIPVDCNVSDNVGIGSVIVRATAPNNSLKNYSASFVSGNLYRASVDLDAVGNWSFGCFANDSVGNSNYSEGSFAWVDSGKAELFIVDEIVAFNVTPNVEGESVNVSVNVSNLGCVGSGNFVVGFYDGVLSFENLTVSVGAKGFLNVSALWSTDIGLSNIFVHIDLDEEVNEDNESNNSANNSIYLKAWQDVYGNVSLDFVLSAANDTIGRWDDEVNFAGNIFVVDSESDIEWTSLQAIGRTKLGALSSGDFSEIDSLLGMSSYNDSVSITYSSSGLDNFSVFGNDIVDVPYVNSSENGNFVTGILWDTSDSADSEYDSGEGEDIAFIAKVNLGNVGSYGVYDYEICVPSKLRGYDSADEELVYLYYDLK